MHVHELFVKSQLRLHDLEQDEVAMFTIVSCGRSLECEERGLKYYLGPIVLCDVQSWNLN